MHNFISNKNASFFFFGCWNRIGCPEFNLPGVQGAELPKDETALTRVVSSLIEYKKAHGLDFGIIAGDNIYPTKSKISSASIDSILERIPEKIPKDKKIKNYSNIQFANGVKCLSLINVPLLGCLGNHDIKQVKKMSQSSDYDECFVLSNQIKTKPFHQWFMPHNYYNIEMETGTFIFIDCNILHTEHLDELEYCYSKNNLNSDANLMKSWFYDIIKTKFTTPGINTNLFIIGHEPIVSFKPSAKKMNFNIDPDITNLFTGLLDNQIIPSVEIYYLCAHTHNYQNISITLSKGDYTIKIRQYVAGIGGAIPDIHQNSSEYHKTRSNIINNQYTQSISDDLSITYKINDYREIHGFLTVNVNSKNLPEFQIHPVINLHNPTPVFDTKYILYKKNKYKNKYLKLKDILGFYL